MPFAGEYKCSLCGKQEQRDMLVSKKVMFQELGVKPRVFRSRVVGWYCPQCVAKDPDWKQPSYSSPGMQTADSQ